VLSSGFKENIFYVSIIQSPFVFLSLFIKVMLEGYMRCFWVSVTQLFKINPAE